MLSIQMLFEKAKQMNGEEHREMVKHSLGHVRIQTTENLTEGPSARNDLKQDCITTDSPPTPPLPDNR